MSEYRNGLHIFYYAGNIAYDVSETSIKAPCEAPATHDRHVCKGLYDSVLHTFVRAIINYKRTEPRMKGSGFFPAAHEKFLMITTSMRAAWHAWRCEKKN